MSRSKHPRFSEHHRVFHSGLVGEQVAMAGVSFDHVLLVAVNQSESFNNLMAKPFAECRRFRVSLTSA